MGNKHPLVDPQMADVWLALSVCVSAIARRNNFSISSPNHPKPFLRIFKQEKRFSVRPSANKFE